MWQLLRILGTSLGEPAIKGGGARDQETWIFEGRPCMVWRRPSTFSSGRLCSISSAEEQLGDNALRHGWGVDTTMHNLTSFWANLRHVCLGVQGNQPFDRTAKLYGLCSGFRQPALPGRYSV